MVFNDSECSQGGRENLRLAVSDLHGRNWTRIATLEDTAHVTSEYPYIIQTRDGFFHIVYSYDIKKIKHLMLNEAWIEDRISKAGQFSLAE